MDGHSFHKSERLTGKKNISLLFEKGKAINHFPLKMLWSKQSEKDVSPAQICIAVPKRNFKKAHDRNYIKRKCREAYRKNKETLYHELEKKNINLALLLIYTGKEDLPYEKIESKMLEIINSLCKHVA